MTIYEAIYKRKSVRKYTSETISTFHREHIDHFMDCATCLHPTIPIAYEIVTRKEDGDRIGLKTNVKAPQYLVFYTKIEPGCYENAGYILEQCVLYMTTKGIGSCYIGRNFIEPNKDYTNQGYEMCITLAFGYPLEDLFQKERKIERMDLKKLYVVKDGSDNRMLPCIESARLAPSGLNLQPCRYVIYQNRLHIFIRLNKLSEKLFLSMNHINAGIAICHIILSAEEQWGDPQYFKSSLIEERSLNKHLYIGSVQLN